MKQEPISYRADNALISNPLSVIILRPVEHMFLRAHILKIIIDFHLLLFMGMLGTNLLVNN